MTVSSHLLERAYQLIDANQIENAELVLDAVVRVDPRNLEAWKTYMRIYQDQNDLDWLKERILKTRELGEIDKTWLIDYYLHLRQQNRKSIVMLHLQEEGKESAPVTVSSSDLELLDVFDYPARAVIRKITGRFPRPVYNSKTLDMGLGRKKNRGGLFEHAAAVAYGTVLVWSGMLAKTAKQTYARLSQSPYFERYIVLALLALFSAGVRLAVSGWFVGYVFLAAFFAGVGWWLVNFGNQSSGHNRVYMHEHKIALPEIKQAESEPEQESDVHALK
ncbi:MAG: hypothetical protein HYZ23_10430 [Chloroflexi bacterium]|nr:hypothetical protein [Chloroflexota bacterium]